MVLTKNIVINIQIFHLYRLFYYLIDLLQKLFHQILVNNVSMTV